MLQNAKFNFFFQMNCEWISFLPNPYVMLIQEHLKIHIILDQRPTIIFIYFTVYSNANCLQKLIQAEQL